MLQVCMVNNENVFVRGQWEATQAENVRIQFLVFVML